MTAKNYEDVMLIMGVLSTRGFPDSLKRRLESEFGPIAEISEPFPFSFTDYYVPEMGNGIMRFFIRFSDLIQPDRLASVKEITNAIESSYMEEGGRKINLDPGTLSDASLILATTKNRSHRIAIGRNLFAEVTLIYQNHSYISFPWTYADYRSEKVQKILLSYRSELLAIRRKAAKTES